MRGEKFEDQCGITSNVIGILEGISRENEEECYYRNNSKTMS